MSKRVRPANPNGESGEVLALLRDPAGKYRWAADLWLDEDLIESALATEPARAVAARIDGYVRSYAKDMLPPWPLATSDDVYLWLRRAWFGPVASQWGTRTGLALGLPTEGPRVKRPRATTVSEWWVYQEDGYARDGSVLPDPTEPAQIAERARRNAIAADVPLEWRIAGAALHWQLACREGMETAQLMSSGQLNKVRGRDAQQWLESLK